MSAIEASAAPPHLTTLLLLGLPPSTFVGVDLFSFTTAGLAPKPPQKHTFNGLKLIPPGIHELYFSPGPYGDFTPRTSIWLSATGAPGSVIILKWDKTEEKLVDESSLTPEELEKIKGEWHGWWRGGSLVEYRSGAGTGVETVGDSRLWRELTSEMNERTLERILGAGKHVGGYGERIWRVHSASSAPQDRDDEILSQIALPKSDPDTEMAVDSQEDEFQLSLLPIDMKRTFPPNATGRERTLAATDRTWYLGDIISKCLSTEADPEQQILAELQFTFLLGLTLSNFSASEGWKRILSLVLTCEARVLTNVDFFAKTLEILATQLGSGLDCFAPPTGGGEEAGAAGEEDESGATYIPDFLAESSPSFDIQRLLRSFLRTLHRLQEDLPPAPSSPEVFQKHRELENLLALFSNLEALADRKFGWTLDPSKVVKKGMVQLEDGEMVELELAGLMDEDEDEEGEGPVVVEL
ncbi:A1 cistron-splicing factor [Peziza echinospora]|nr:A1 cistron-splicing factor [Peziza echinospora]